jgi:hypothetical protein
MSLFKKIIFSVFVVLAIGVGIWAYLSLKNSKKPNVDALSALPDNCLVYLNTNNFFELNKKINSQSLIADKLKLFGDVNSFCNTLNVFDSVFASNTILEEIVNTTKIHFALYEKNSNWLVTFNIKRLGNQDKIVDELSKTFKAKEIENNIYVFNLNKSDKYYFTLNSGVALISNSPETIDLSLNKSTEKLQNNKQFIEFKSTLQENTILSIYVNHQLYLKNKVSSKLNLSLLCENGFSAGNIDIEPSQLTVNGYLKPKDSELIAAFYDQEPQSLNFLNLLPNNTAYFKAFGFSSFEKLNQKTNKLGKNNNNNFWELVADSALYNVENDFEKNAENYLVNFETKLPNEKFVLLKIIDTVKTIEQIGYMSDSVYRKDSVSIYKLKTKSLKTSLNLFASFFNVTTNYVALINSHLVFTETKIELENLITNLKNGNSISENESFMTYKNQNLSEDFNFLVYSSPTKNKEDISILFNFEKTSKVDAFENFKHFSFSLSNNSTNFKFRWHLINVAETVNKEQNLLWTLNLDAPSSMPTNGFINHITNENELAIQDDEQNLYLVNAKGTILWKKKINEKISSKIFTVDIFKKNKYQLLFSSKNYLHLIDRNGNYVQGYPVKLPDESTSELSLIDYDNDKDYRLFIACKNKTIYNYSIFGIKQDKFIPVRTENEVNLPIQYAKVGLSDYLIAVDKFGKVYTFSRKGEGRIGLKNKTIENCSAFYVDATNNINSTYLIYVDDKNNLLNKISFSDKKVIEKLDRNIESGFIKFDQVDAHKTTDLLITKPNALLSFDLNGNLLFEKTLDNELSESTFYSDENLNLFLTFSKNKQELIILDQLKQKTKSLKASALPFVSNLFNDNKKYLIVTDGNRLNCVAL